MKEKRFEILEGLPPYGPMYIAITENDEPYVSEGFVVRFYKSDGSNWVANFKPGWTDCSIVKHFPESNTFVVLANGMGYLMSPDHEKPIKTFGISINNAIELEEGGLLVSDDIQILILNGKGIEWQSPRISWDGIKELKLNDNILTGVSYDPMNDKDEWCDFSIDLNTKEIIGGSYRHYYTNSNQSIRKKPWWKIRNK